MTATQTITPSYLALLRLWLTLVEREGDFLELYASNAEFREAVDFLHSLESA